VLWADSPTTKLTQSRVGISPGEKPEFGNSTLTVGTETCEKIVAVNELASAYLFHCRQQLLFIFRGQPNQFGRLYSHDHNSCAFTQRLGWNLDFSVDDSADNHLHNLHSKAEGSITRQE
jgi:hypothetical protein